MSDDLGQKIEQIVSAVERNECDAALSMLMPLVKSEIPSALGLMGVLYQTGQCVDQNIFEAIELLEKAVALGDGAAAHNLGTIFCSAHPGVKLDVEKGKKYYQLAKHLGFQAAPNEFYE